MEAPALVLLAAGAGRRLGQVKALAVVREHGNRPRTPLACLLAAGADAFAGTPPLVVLGAEAARVARELPVGVESVVNPRWAAGRTGSVATAVRARAQRDLCLAPVDVPCVPAAVFRGLAAAWDEAGRPACGWLAPFVVLEGRPRHGHPIVVGRTLLAELEHFAPDRPLRALRALAKPLLALEVRHPEILDDLDTPDDLRRIREREDPSAS